MACIGCIFWKHNGERSYDDLLYGLCSNPDAVSFGKETAHTETCGVYKETPLNAQQPKCKTCGGSGVCPFCKGGRITSHEGYGDDVEFDCSQCKGTGKCPDCQQPKCKTCGGSGEIFIEKRAGGYFSDPSGKGKPCPKCQPATQTGELTLANKLRQAIALLVIADPEDMDTPERTMKIGNKAAARIEELEKALEKIEAIEKGYKIIGIGYDPPIYEIAKAGLSEETQNG